MVGPIANDGWSWVEWLMARKAGFDIHLSELQELVAGGLLQAR